MLGSYGHAFGYISNDFQKSLFTQMGIGLRLKTLPLLTDSLITQLKLYLVLDVLTVGKRQTF